MEKNYQPKSNSLKHTFCVFIEVSLAEIDSLVLQYESKAGSRYYYTKKGMYRLSNHWGRLANSKWRLIAAENETDSKFKLGFAKWDTFYPDNNVDKLYYLVADYEKKTISYEHKNNPTYNGEAILRTSLETKKRIKQARNIMELTSWSYYIEYTDLELLRKEIVDNLINSDGSLETIKRNFR
jgi:hypothetical protein